MSDAQRPSAAMKSAMRAAQAPAAPAAGRNDAARMEVARLIEHLRAQLEELDRREANLNRQFLSLDGERRAIRLAAQQSQLETAQRDEAVTTRETALAAREEASEKRAAELERAEQALLADRAAFHREQSGLRAQFEQERAAAAAELQSQRSELRAEVAAELADLRAELETQRQEQSAAGELLEQQRSGLRAQIAEEYEDLQAELEARQREFEAREAPLLAREEAQTRLASDLEKRTRFHEEHLAKLRREIASQKAELEQAHQSHRAWSLQVDESIRFRLAHMRRFRDLLDRREESLERESERLQASRESAERELSQQREALAAQAAARQTESEANHAEIQRQQDLLNSHAQNLEARKRRLDRLRDELDTKHQETLEMRLAVEQVFAQASQQTGADTAQERVEEARENLLQCYRDLRETLLRRKGEADQALHELEEARGQFLREQDEQRRSLTERESILLQRERKGADQSSAAASRERDWLAARDRWRDDQQEAERVIRDLLKQLETSAAANQGWTSGSTAHSVVPLPPDDRSFEEIAANLEPPDSAVAA